MRLCRVAGGERVIAFAQAEPKSRWALNDVSTSAKKDGAGYVISGQSVTSLPAGSLGYVWLPALGVIATCSVLTAPLGAKAAHNLPVKKLKRVFASLLFGLAAYMFWKGAFAS